jgi:Zinc knuckle
VRKSWVLLVGLKPEIRRGVMIEHKIITSREKVISATQRQEELLRKDKEEREGATAPQTSSRRLARSYQGRGGASSVRTASAHSKEDKAVDKTSSDTRQCFKCKERGHISRYCPNKKHAKSEGNAAVAQGQAKKE